MEIVVRQGNIVEQQADLLVVNLFEGVTEPGGATGAVDRALNGAIREVIAAGDFKGARDSSVLLYTRGALSAPRVLVVGLGPAGKFDLNQARRAAAIAARRARELGVKEMATIVHGAGVGGLAPDDAAQAVVEGSLLALYRFRKHVPEPEAERGPQRIALVEFDAQRLPAIQDGAARGRVIAEATNFVRDLVNEPANYMTPIILAERASAMARELGLRCTVLDENQMRELGMGLLLGVAAGTYQPPRFIILEYNADRTDLPTIVLVGKGITFDSGGISLKPSEEMWRMKDDMGGAAAVIGALQVAARLSLPLRVIGLAPCTENLPGGRAIKPGDVLTGMTGKTVEIISTDAEGRLILADALAYADRYQPQAVIDLATLTGAIGVALGKQAAGLFANNDQLAERLLQAAERSGERLWRMPLYDEYKELIKSEVAEIKNAAKRNDGVGTSAKFLEHFTSGYPWAHLDIAAMVLDDEDSPLGPRGATGYGVRLLAQFLRDWAKS
ncbi:MAG: leucyl aminopeptidase [Anaerolineae bacterium]|nr:leucyl aminopeptidase [Anaerolineae bacterium]MDW8099488.1 leucyl aminopeptidase [Anaerolineae bacterium]